MSNERDIRNSRATVKRQSQRTKMESPKTKQTQPKQFEILVDFLKAHPDLSKGLLKTADARNASANLWKRLSEQLNTVGPPMRDVAGWKKVWADYKVHLKAKLRRNKHNFSGTGGGPSTYVSLTQLEQQVSELLFMDQSVSGISGTLAFGSAPSTVPEQPLETPNECDNSEPSTHLNALSTEPNTQEDELPHCSNAAHNPCKKQSLLERQVENQIMFHENSVKALYDINFNLKNIFKTSKKNRKLEKRKLEFEKEKFLFNQNRHQQKFKLKLSKLEFQKEALEIEMRAKDLIANKNANNNNINKNANQF